MFCDLNSIRENYTIAKFSIPLKFTVKGYLSSLRFAQSRKIHARENFGWHFGKNTVPRKIFNVIFGLLEPEPEPLFVAGAGAGKFLLRLLTPAIYKGVILCPKVDPGFGESLYGLHIFTPSETSIFISLRSIKDTWASPCLWVPYRLPCTPNGSKTISKGVILWCRVAPCFGELLYGCHIFYSPPPNLRAFPI